MNDTRSECLVGVISDTHGLMRPEALKTFQGVSLIIHAGDVGAPEVLEQLRSIAPVVAVRGNMDQGQWAHALPLTEAVDAGAVSIYVLHNIGDLDLDPATSGFGAVISGHSHEPLKEKRNGVFFLNPGSAGPRRFKLPVTVAVLSIKEKKIVARIIGLGV
ncbi:MAG: metallophosphoesterase family protein [Nitrospirae bacterium]|nr:metallophosphoesterase family protein [Nitrospirota bacterium]